MNLLNPVCPLLATHWFMQAYKLLSIRSLYVVWPQVSKTNKYMPNFKQMSCFKGKGFWENLELNFFYKELKQIHCFQMSLLTESKHPDIWICWFTILYPNQMKYSWFFNRNTEYLTMAEPLSVHGRSWTFLQSSGVSILESSKASLGTEFILFFKAVDFFSLWFKKEKKTFWVFLSKSCIKILFLLSKQIIHMVASHKHALEMELWNYVDNILLFSNQAWLGQQLLPF